ncbi:di-heme-cytochrome C peroxidase [Xanthobacter sp. KR7-225]|uniref:di-heme-cytochrome C peroxidase n=1 Tax=Xanthobacter sp. KR7-225 TaxID=3156613 RepID=UPI0032B33607
MARRIIGVLAAILVVGALVAGVELYLTRPDTPPPPEAALPPPAFLDQGWSAEMREAFYYTPQGSRLLPYAFLLALEQPDGDGLFLDDRHIAATGFLPAPAASPRNPDRLPVGFAKDPAPGGAAGPMVGLTCAACHTGEITLAGTRVWIDGGAAAGDFQMLMARLSKALDATLSDPAKFARFAARLKQDPKAVHAQLEATATEIRRIQAAAFTPVPYGRGRLDAFGHILNAIAAEALGVEANFRIPDAPVSYPFLWTTPGQRYVQWNGVAGNPIGRNLGEVLGVFGHANLAGGNVAAFSSAALLDNLKQLEDWVATLKPPPYPQNLLGPVDPVLAANGAELFKTHCAGCHGGPDYRYTAAAETEGGRRWLAVSMVPQEVVKTDPKMLVNFAGRMAETGPLAPAFGGAPRVPAGGILLLTANAMVENDLRARGITGDARKAYYGWRFAPGSEKPQAGWAAPPAYKTGPLAGIWATGPFLHNGSVPTVYDLLAPEEERPKTFYVGATRYDPKKLGFVSSEEDLSTAEQARAFRFDTTLPGNSNAGHPFPEPRLKPQDRYAIVEYLKILEGPR